MSTNLIARREAMFGLGATLGTLALQALLQAEAGESPSPLAPKKPHHEPRAKRCLFLFMEGGPSHIDTFDPKPMLDKLDLQEFQRSDKFASAMSSGKRYYVRSPFKFRQVNDAGLHMCDRFEQLASVANELCVYRGLTAQSIDHPTACYDMNTGSRFGGDPAVGAWTSYGLGTENQNLPSFVVLPEVNFPQGGAANWSNGFLPPQHQATTLRAAGSPLLDLRPPAHVTPETQRANLDLLGELERAHQQRHPQHAELAARLDAYELAFRMQTQVPELINLASETKATLEAYGLEGNHSAEVQGVGRRLLMARRLLEQGVRFVQVYVSGWDSHDYIERSHGNRMAAIDRPITALLTDLQQRGLLKDTLVVWAGEFGRSPDNGIRGGKKAGRDHNARAMNVWLAGGGVKSGSVIGATDELGEQAVECVHPLRDFHVTLLHLLGLDDARLTFYHGGRFKQLSQFGGAVIKELLA